MGKYLVNLTNNKTKQETQDYSEIIMRKGLYLQLRKTLKPISTKYLRN